MGGIDPSKAVRIDFDYAKRQNLGGIDVYEKSVNLRADV